MIKYVNGLKDKHKGQDIWIVASGASMNYVDPSFFENKITIGLNRVGVKYKLNYAILKDLVKNGAKEILDSENPPFNSEYVIASEWDKGGCGDGKNSDINKNLIFKKYPNKFYFFKHIRGGYGDTSVLNKNTDKFFISTSTISTSVHIAAFMGAKNIMICGHDMLAVDGKLYFDGYKSSSKGMQEYFVRRDIHSDTAIVRDFVTKEYNCNVYTLNPFIGFNLEGHKYEKLT